MVFAGWLAGVGPATSRAAHALHAGHRRDHPRLHVGGRSPGRCAGALAVAPGGRHHRSVIAHNRKSGDWGFSSRGFMPALLWSIAFTVPLVAALWFIGHAMGPAPIRRAPCSTFSM